MTEHAPLLLPSPPQHGSGGAERITLSPHHGAGTLPLVVGSLMLGKSLEAHPDPVELCNPSKYLEFSEPQFLFCKMITYFLCRTVTRVERSRWEVPGPGSAWFMGRSGSIS